MVIYRVELLNRVRAEGKLTMIIVGLTVPRTRVPQRALARAPNRARTRVLTRARIRRRGVVKEAARSRKPQYIAWSAHRSRIALVLQTAPNAENDQCRDQQQQPRLRLMTPFLPTPQVDNAP
jgi:hypothetical protein